MAGTESYRRPVAARDQENTDDEFSAGKSSGVSCVGYWSSVRSRCTAHMGKHLSHRNQSRPLVGCVFGIGVVHSQLHFGQRGEASGVRGSGSLTTQGPAARTMDKLGLTDQGGTRYGALAIRLATNGMFGRPPIVCTICLR